MATLLDYEQRPPARPRSLVLAASCFVGAFLATTSLARVVGVFGLGICNFWLGSDWTVACGVVADSVFAAVWAVLFVAPALLPPYRRKRRRLAPLVSAIVGLACGLALSVPALIGMCVRRSYEDDSGNPAGVPYLANAGAILSAACAISAPLVAAWRERRLAGVGTERADGGRKGRTRSATD